MAQLERLGRFEVREELGRGGAGLVLRGRDPRTGEEAALKLLAQPVGAPPERARRFRREIEALSRLRHPHLVRVVEHGDSPQGPWLALELLRGRSLQDRLDREGPLPPAEAVRIGQEVALALAYAHGCGLLHRDLKPDNVLIDTDGRAVLTDFGLVKDLELAQSRLSHSGQLLGTPGYWAPEQVDGSGEVGPAADVYGLGATLYAALTGRPPHQAQTLIEALQVTLNEAPEPPRRLRPELDPALEALVLRCLAKRPAERPRDADALARELGSWLRGGGVAPRSRGRRAPALAAGVLLAGAGLSAALLASRSAPRPDSPGASPPSAVPAPAAQPSPPPAERGDAAAPPEVPALDRPRAQDAYDLLESLRARVTARDTSAIPELDRVLTLAPQLALGWAWRGLLRQAAGDLAAARADLDRAVELEPERSEFWGVRAGLRLAQDDLPGAEADAREVLRRDPASVAALELRVRIRLARLDAEGALADADEALRRDPTRADLWHLRASALVRLGRREEALRDISRSLDLEPSAAAYQARGNLLGDLERQEESCRDLEQAVRLDPENGLLRADLARSLARSGDTTRAREEAERALLLAPNEAWPWVVHGGLLLLAGRADVALNELDRALSLAPGDRAALYWRGWALRSLSRSAEAEAVWRALAADPQPGDDHSQGAVAALEQLAAEAGR